MDLALPGEVPPGWPLVEILGNKQVLIENMEGVSCYDACNIMVKVHMGFISVSGSDLELRQVSNNQLVITGTIQAVSLPEWR